MKQGKKIKIKKNDFLTILNVIIGAAVAITYGIFYADIAADFVIEKFIFEATIELQRIEQEAIVQNAKDFLKAKGRQSKA